MNPDHACLFALNASRDFAAGVSRHLGISLAAHEERDFEDGEHKSRPLVNVRGKDVFVIQSLFGDHRQSVNDKLCRLLFFLGALKDASASRVTAVVPYLCYARKDRKSQPRDPVTTRYVAALFEAVGTDCILTMDVHNLAAYQNAFRCRADHLEAAPLFVGHFATLLAADEIVVLSPDVGGVKRAERFRTALSRRLARNIAGGFMEKYRAGGVVSGDTLVAEVTNSSVVIIDDLISSGTTIARAAGACRAAGANRVYAAAAHGLFAGNANTILREAAIDKIVVTDTVPPLRLDSALVHEKLTVIDSTKLFAAAIERIHTGGSLVELLES
jgi:ribose-phosphate pyrophosphokinase